MRVLYIAPNIDFDGNRGGSVHLREISSELSKICDLKIICKGSGKHIIPSSAGRFSLLDFLKIYRAVKWSDVVHTRIDPFELSGLISAKILRKPIVGEVNINFLSYEKKHSLGDIFSPFFYFVKWLWIKFIIARMTKIVCVSETIKKSLVRRGISEKEIFVVRNGGNPNRFPNKSRRFLRKKFNLPEKGLIGILIGEMGPRHGLDEILDLETKDISFLVVGGIEKYRNYFENLKRNAPKNFIFIPQVSYEKSAEYLAASDFALAPYRESSNKEQFGYCPIKILDAMAAGLPVIASDRPWIREILSDMEGVVTGDFELAVEKMRSAKLRKLKGESARRKILNLFSWKNSALQLREIYSGIIQ